MKKTIGLLLAGLLTFSTFVACATDEPVDSTSENTNQNTELYDPMKGVDLSSPKKYIVQNGTSQYKIVIPQEATAAEKYAADELTSFIDQALGVKLQTIVDSNATPSENAKYISIGDTSVLDWCNFNVDYSKLNVEGFIIKTKGDMVVMDGANQHGTLYAVYDFLEKFVGIRFLAPDCTYIPETEELYVHSLNIEEAPYFEYRDVMGDGGYGDTAFATRKRISSGWRTTDSINSDKYGGGYGDYYVGSSDGHSFHRILPPSVYNNPELPETYHPEWYEGSNGKQLCLTNPAVVEEMVKVISGWLVEDTEGKWVVVGQMDSSAMCQCETCYQSHKTNGTESGSLVVFVNQVARGLNAWIDENQPGRELLVETFAYETTLLPPVKTENGKTVPFNENVIPDKNVLVKIAPVYGDFFTPFTDSTSQVNARLYRYMQDWSAISQQDGSMYLYEYSACFSEFFWYYPCQNVMQENYLTYKKLGVNKVLINSISEANDFQTVLKTYLQAELMWNPNKNVNALIQEFCDIYFGADVAPYILECMNRFDCYYQEQGFIGLINNGSSPAYLQSENISLNLLTKTLDIVAEAKNVVNKSNRTAEEKQTALRRIGAWEITPQVMLLCGYNSYYDDISGKKEIGRGFFENTDALGITRRYEGGADISTYRETLDFSIREF